jgi:butyryl-CoA dehydrogenase
MTALSDTLGALRGANNEAEMLANATNFLSAFGHVVVGFIWLSVVAKLPGEGDFAAGKKAAARFFFAFEMPKVAAWLAPVARRDRLTVTMQDAWF